MVVSSSCMVTAIIAIAVIRKRLGSALAGLTKSTTAVVIGRRPRLGRQRSAVAVARIGGALATEEARQVVIGAGIDIDIHRQAGAQRRVTLLQDRRQLQ